MVVICVKYLKYLDVQKSDIPSHCIKKSNYNFIIFLMKFLQALDNLSEMGDLLNFDLCYTNPNLARNLF